MTAVVEANHHHLHSSVFLSKPYSSPLVDALDSMTSTQSPVENLSPDEKLYARLPTYPPLNGYHYPNVQLTHYGPPTVLHSWTHPPSPGSTLPMTMNSYPLAYPQSPNPIHQSQNLLGPLHYPVPHLGTPMPQNPIRKRSKPPPNIPPSASSTAPTSPKLSPKLLDVDHPDSLNIAHAVSTNTMGGSNTTLYDGRDEPQEEDDSGHPPPPPVYMYYPPALPANFPPPPPVCRYYGAGRCWMGSACRFTHLVPTPSGYMAIYHPSNRGTPFTGPNPPPPNMRVQPSTSSSSSYSPPAQPHQAPFHPLHNDANGNSQPQHDPASTANAHLNPGRPQCRYYSFGRCWMNEKCRFAHM